MQLRKERAEFKPDDRFLHVVNMIRTGQFGWADCECRRGLGRSSSQLQTEPACQGGACCQAAEHGSIGV